MPWFWSIVIMGLEIDSMILVFCVILSFSGQVWRSIEVSSSLKYGVMQHRKPFRWGKDRHRMLRKGEKSVCMFQKSYLMNLRNWWLKCSKKIFRTCNEDPLEKAVFMSCLFWNERVCFSKKTTVIFTVTKDLPKKPLILDLFSRCLPFTVLWHLCLF